MMLVMLGVDTQFGMMEGFITPLMELTFLRKMSTALCTGKSDYHFDLILIISYMKLKNVLYKFYDVNTARSLKNV